MTMLYDHGERPRVPVQARREPRIFQEEFLTEDIPLPVEMLHGLSTRVKYPYPPQVVVIGSMFPVPVPVDFLKDTNVKPVKIEGKKAWLKQPRNLVISFSTAAGKTFLAELYMAKYVQHGGVAVYTCPLKSLAEEKYKEFSELFPSLKVGIMTGDFHQIRAAEMENYDIIVSTMNKLDSILRNTREKIASVISCAVVDEIHVINDNPVVDDVLMKIKDLNIPIMAMSATVANGKDIASWLDAEIVKSDFRPVPLKMGLLINDEIEYKDGTFEKFSITQSDNVEKVIAAKAMKGEQVMHVRQSRLMAESFAKRLVPKLGGTFFDENLDLPVKIGDKEMELNRCIKYGVAWHHAGLTAENRAYIEDNFKQGKIRVICATTTLGAGINIPAKHVFMEWKRYNGFGNEPLTSMEVLQILHRAGRPQFDDEGYGILVCKKEEDCEYCVNEYFPARPEPVRSGLTRDASYLFHSMIGNVGRVKTRSEMISLYRNSFAHHQNPSETKRRIEAIMDTFSTSSTPMIAEKNGEFALTELGMLVKRYYVNPADAMIIAGMIDRSTTLSLAAIVHGIMRCETMYPLRIKGSDETWLERFASIKPSLHYKDFNVNNEREWRAFQTTYVLVGDGNQGDFIYIDENVTAGELCYAHGIQFGDLQRVVGAQGNMSWLLGFAGAVARMYKKHDIAREINDLDIMLRYGVSKKLVEVCRIRNVGKERGKALFTVGYCDVESIALANPGDVADIKVNDKKKIGIKVASAIVTSAREIMEKERKE